MPHLDVFFDYSCPYCYRAHALLMALLPAHPEVSVTWRPCEAHPRPETYGEHSDLCIRGMFYARDQGVDLLAYHAAMYAAVFERHVAIEDPAALAASLTGLLDAAAFEAMLRSDAYEAELAAANDLAYEQSGVWAVPAYRAANGKKLDAAENIGVTQAQLEAFLRQA